MSVRVLSDHLDIERRLRDVLNGARIATSSLGDAVAVNTSSDVVVIDAARDPDAAFRLAQDFDRDRPDVVLVLYANRNDGMLSRALQVGVREVISPGDDDEKVREALERAIALTARRRQATRRSEVGVDHRLIMVLSPKGGAGKTTIASNLAVGIAQRAPREVVLIDGDLQFGDVGNALCLLPDTNIRHAIAGGLNDATEVKVHLTPHRSGLFALCAPEVPGLADEISAPAFTKAVSLIGQDFRYVVVDTDPGLGERTLAVMDHATDLVFVAATDVASVRGLHKTMDALERIGLNRARRHFVLNRADAKVGVQIEDVVSTLGMEPDVLVPSSRAVPISMNNGVPVLESGEVSAVVDPLWALVDRFIDDPDGSAADSRRGGGLFRRRA